MKLNNSTYNVLKFVALVVLPAVATAYVALAGIWHLPHADQVVATVSAIDTFLGAMLHVSTKSYSAAVAKKPVIDLDKTDGRLIVDKSDPDKDVYRLDVTTPLADLDKLGHIVLKVEPGSSIEMKTTKP